MKINGYNEIYNYYKDSKYRINDRPFIPVLVGGDIFIYSMAVMFYESLGVMPVVLIAQDVKVVTTTKFAFIKTVSKTDDDKLLLSELELLSKSFENVNPYMFVMGTGDWYARNLSKNADFLHHIGFVTPYCDYKTFDEITQKEVFQSICSKLNIPVPHTYFLDCDSEKSEINPCDHGFNYPVIAKPSNSAEWHYVDFPQKAKIMTVNSDEGLEEIYTTLRSSCYNKQLLVQDMIPGFDESLYSITCFAWQGHVVFSILGHVLLQDHAPSAIGNPVVIVGNTEMPEWKERLLLQAESFLKEIKYSGFANFDIMYDSRDDTYRFLEVNARLGRNSWYVNLAGVDLPKIIVDYFVKSSLADSTKNSPLITSNEVFHGNRDFVFKMVPNCVISKYAADCPDKIQALSKNADRSPATYHGDCLKHRFWGWITNFNQINKFKKYVG